MKNKNNSIIKGQPECNKTEYVTYEEKKNVNFFLYNFINIRSLGYTNAPERNYKNAGSLFEHLLGIQANSKQAPDFKGIEIKTKYGFLSDRIRLFCHTPDGPGEKVLYRITKKYGYKDTQYKRYKCFGGIINSKEAVKIGVNYYFKLEVDWEKEKVNLLSYNKSKIFIEKIAYWNFDGIIDCLLKKEKILAIVKAFKKEKNNKIFFKYYQVNIYYLKDKNLIIDLIANGIIKIGFSVGFHKEKEKFGQIYDHGTTFIIDEKNIELLYQKQIFKK